MRVLLAGGGTAGHVNPLLATAQRLRERHPDAELVVLGTREGLERELVPRAGLELVTIDKLPFPRRPDAAALRFPAGWRRAAYPNSHHRASGSRCGSASPATPPAASLRRSSAGPRWTPPTRSVERWCCADASTAIWIRWR